MAHPLRAEPWLVLKVKKRNDMMPAFKQLSPTSWLFRVVENGLGPWVIHALYVKYASVCFYLSLIRHTNHQNCQRPTYLRLRRIRRTPCRRKVTAFPAEQRQTFFEVAWCVREKAEFCWWSEDTWLADFFSSFPHLCSKETFLSIKTQGRQKEWEIVQNFKNLLMFTSEEKETLHFIQSHSPYSIDFGLRKARTGPYVSG